MGVLDKKGRAAESMVGSQSIRNTRPHADRSEEMKGSLVKEITRINNQFDDHNMPEKEKIESV